MRSIAQPARPFGALWQANRSELTRCLSHCAVSSLLCDLYILNKIIANGSAAAAFGAAGCYEQDERQQAAAATLCPDKLLLLLQVCARNVEEEDEEQQRRYSELEQHRDRQQRLPKEATGGSKIKSKGGKEKDGRPKEPKKTQITVSNDSTPAPGSAVLAAPRPAAFLIWVAS